MRDDDFLKERLEAIWKLLFDDVPEYIIDLTIAHELSHYAHGFNSPLKRKYKHPHKGGVVTKEMTSRGFDRMIKMEKMFFRKEWPKIYERIVKFKNIN